MELRRTKELPQFQNMIDKTLIREIFHPRNSRIDGISIAYARLERNSSSEKHMHRKAQEVYFILKGKGTVYVGGEMRKVGEWDAILIPPATEHFIKNSGSRPLEFLCISFPPYEDEDTVPTSTADMGERE